MKKWKTTQNMSPKVVRKSYQNLVVKISLSIRKIQENYNFYKKFTNQSKSLTFFLL